MVKIIHIQPNSIAEELGISIGDYVVSINGRPVTDALDYRYYITQEEVELEIEHEGERILYDIEKEYDENLGIELEDLEMRECGNSCIFCFVFQNPKKLRRTLYFKDEDYRFSFLYGHYTTLTNAAEEDLKRIVEQRLSPLYISVHVTDLELRKLMLGIKFDDRLFEKIEYLTSNGIELNCQIVLCPELNDGPHLDKTITDLKRYYPMVRSVAIVPVGLTRFRKNLFPIKPVTHEYALNVIRETDSRREQLKQELGSSFVYLSDEFYIRTDYPLPESDYYEGFFQLENGVGLSRDFISRFEEEYPHLLKMNTPVNTFSLVTGMLGAKVLERYFMEPLNQLPDKKFILHPVENQFYGPSITVAGLLVGEDIYNCLKDQETGEVVVLPPRVLNDDGLFIDDWTVPMLADKLGKRVVVFPDSFIQLFDLVGENEVTHHSNHR